MSLSLNTNMTLAHINISTSTSTVTSRLIYIFVWFYKSVSLLCDFLSAVFREPSFIVLPRRDFVNGRPFTGQKSIE